MPVYHLRAARAACALALCCGMAACSSLDSASERVAGIVTPYKIEVVQGNFVSREQVQALQIGMGRQQVRELLGTPLVMSLFHADRWDYVFTIKRQGVQPQARRLSVYFKGDVLERFEGDEMPTEAEFVATLDTHSRKGAAIPPLEATEAQLAKYPAPAAPAEAAPPPVPAVNYPPLEPATTR
ncbi:outer membrane protein assembly factor BamE [Ramlibacter sp. H39-3-26]|uniref:outer membrane protein assembly factor BamE n=1 Tax=Curvibacter soli TaxID=3031331 RepID=UPI0023DBFA0B|nr:outer membrane protein assembly factor BamE [Ramlibacter sp. H39-3-26]MDF1486037.1 outer membrane protein assembly factor BamE [Ramlibacter sp. H39-3-26]